MRKEVYLGLGLLCSLVLFGGCESNKKHEGKTKGEIWEEREKRHRFPPMRNFPYRVGFAGYEFSEMTSDFSEFDRYLSFGDESAYRVAE